MTKKSPPKTPSAPAVDRAAPDTAFRRVIAALLTPAVETMRIAGIARLTIEDDSVLLQMETGAVLGPLRVGNIRRTLGTFLAWSVSELGEGNARHLLDIMEPNVQTVPTEGAAKDS